MRRDQSDCIFMALCSLWWHIRLRTGSKPALTRKKIARLWLSEEEVSSYLLLRMLLVALAIKTYESSKRMPSSPFLEGNNVFVALPTGYGKSLYYGCLPVAFDSPRSEVKSIVIVISPLVALKDQVKNFQNYKKKHVHTIVFPW